LGNPSKREAWDCNRERGTVKLF